jgi:hypothetical protein
VRTEVQTVIAAAIAVLAIVVVSLAARAAGKKFRAAAGPRSRAGKAASPASGEVVAVIAAAVSAASGMEIGSFRIVGVEPSRSSIAQCGFNTPVWGHVDRFARGEKI